MSGARPAIAGLCALGALLAVVGILGVASPRDARAPGRDVAAADGIPFAATADEAATQRIRLLASAAQQEPDLPRITVDYPLDASVFPPDLAPPTFLWHDASENATAWLVDIAFGGGSTRLRVLVPGVEPPQGEIDRRAVGENNELPSRSAYEASARSWKPSPEVWDAIRKHAVDAAARLTFLGYEAQETSRVLSRGSVTIRTSADPVGAPIFYRDVPLMPSTGKDGVIKPLSEGSVPLIGWRLKDVSRDGSRLLLEDMPTCANCHSFSADGKTFGMDVDGPDGDKGAYGLVPLQKSTVIQAGQVISWNRFKGRPEGRMTLGFLARVSPNGKYVVSTVNDALYVQNFTNYKFLQVFYPTRGILAYYSRDTGEILALPGADDPEYVHCGATWSPDGKFLVFSRAKATDPYPKGRPRATYAGDPNETPIQYDLVRIPFQDGRGGVATPVAGASANGWSNTFPKVSPDGKWIVFTRCRNGQLQRPDGELFIVPFDGGEARRMRCNTKLMNSWHSFSPNGRWLVFSSKANTPYTQMFLTHIDESGNDTPPILVENATAANRAVNIPEFVNVRFDEFQSIAVPAVDHWRHMKAGARLAKEGRHGEAIVEFEKALEGEYHDWRTNDWKTHANMSTSLTQMGDLEPALEHLRRSLELNPRNAEMQTNLGYLLAERGENREALKHLDLAVQLSPRDTKIRGNRAKLRMSLGDVNGGLEDFGEAIRLDPNGADAWAGRGAARMGLKDLKGARSDLDRAVELDPSSASAWYFRALVRQQADDLPGSLADLDRARALVPPGSVQLREIDALRAQIREALDRNR